MEFSWCDYIISGEGEYPFARLCDSLNYNTDFSIPGLCYRKDRGIIVNEPYIAEGEPPSPYCEEYFDALHGRIAYLETSRGCPYSCAFCLSGRCGGVRFFDIERAKKAKAKAETRLSDTKSDDYEHKLAEIKLKKSLARLGASERK